MFYLKGPQIWLQKKHSKKPLHSTTPLHSFTPLQVLAYARLRCIKHAVTCNLPNWSGSARGQRVVTFSNKHLWDKELNHIKVINREIKHWWANRFEHGTRKNVPHHRWAGVHEKVERRQESIVKNSKWVWSGNTTITNRKQTHGTARKSHTTITRHQEDKPSKATGSLIPIKMIAKLERTYSNVQQNI